MEGNAQDLEQKAKTINKYPLAVVVIILTALLTTFINQFFKTSEGRKDDCQKELDNSRQMIREKDKIINDYTRTILYKDAQIKNRESALDSVKNKIQ